jgi:pyrroloquinoline-quinone synthase
MDDFVELRKRAKQMYANITTPQQQPYFPPPPKEFLDPEQFVDTLSELVFVHHTKVNHPFCVKLVRGEWMRPQLQEWVKQDFHAKVQTLRNDALIMATAATLQEMKKQATVVASEAGADNLGYPSHPDLWLQFAAGLGLTVEEVESTQLSPLMQIVLDAERYKSGNQKIGGLPSNMRLGERINAIVYPIWAEALEEKYGVPHEALTFFVAHGEADEDHGEIGRQIVMSRAITLEAQQQIWEHQAASQTKQWINYDAFYQAAMRAADPVAVA